MARPYLYLIWVIFQTSGSGVTHSGVVVGALASEQWHAGCSRQAPPIPPCGQRINAASVQRGQAKAPALAPAHPAPPLPATGERARPSRHDGAGRSGRSGAPAQQCLHTHLARARTQITLIHFKPTLSPAALQQILLKPCLHNRQSRPAAALQ